MVYIFTIATGKYKEYFERYFLPSLKNIFKNKQKIVILFSDGLKRYDRTFFNANIEVKHIYDMYKFSIQFNKYNLIEQELATMNVTNEDILMYVDIDTIFISNHIAEQYIESTYNDGRMHISVNPFDIYYDFYDHDNHQKDRINVYTNVQYQGKFTFHPTKEYDLITSFMYFNKETFYKFKKLYDGLVLDMEDKDNFVCPYMNDEGLIQYTYHTQHDSFIVGEMIITINVLDLSNNLDTHIIDPFNDINHNQLIIDNQQYVIANQKFNNMYRK